jgi:D-alanine-D-alanine ligase
VLQEASAVASSLRELGWEPVELDLTPDLERAARELSDAAPAIVFNLVESVEGRGRYIVLAQTLLETLGIPFTGASLEAMIHSTSKPATKRLLGLGGVRAPAWMPAEAALATPPRFPPTWIVKNAWEHASIGLDDESVVADAAALRRAIVRRATAEGLENLFIEEFVDGREFNLSVLGRRGAEPDVLPPAEIRFVDFPAGKPRMVGYKAKWDERSPEFGRTPRSFEFPPGDAALLADLAAISRRCWSLFGLRGHARVDFRVDARSVPWVLEVNANPCISPDAGFAAAAARAGLSMRDTVARIVADTLGKESP